jgi:hypothetical protein
MKTLSLVLLPWWEEEVEEGEYSPSLRSSSHLAGEDRGEGEVLRSLSGRIFLTRQPITNYLINFLLAWRFSPNQLVNYFTYQLSL